MGLSTDVVNQNAQFIRPAYRIALETPQWSHGLPAIKDYFYDALKKIHPGLTDAKAVAEQEKITQAFTPEIYSLIRFDPAQYLPKVACPILAMNGSKDVQVLPTENLNAIRTITQKNKNVTI